MKEFTIKYNMKLKNDNIELEFKVNENEFETTIEKLQNEYIPFISNTKNKPIKTKNNSSKKKSSVSNNKKKDNKNQNTDCKKVELNLNKNMEENLHNFYNLYIKNSKLDAYKKILLLFYWLKDNDIGKKINKHIIYSILFIVSDKIDFGIEDNIQNCKRRGRAYINNNKDKGFYITISGIKLSEDIIKNNKENA